MRKLYLIIALLFFATAVATAQKSLREGQALSGLNQKPSVQKTSLKGNSNISRGNKVHRAHALVTTGPTTRLRKNAFGNRVVPGDTLLCSQMKKQHGWFAPLDTISRETASHRGRHYRFTNKNQVGHWLKVEVLNAYGNYVTGSFRPYALKKSSSDPKADSDWNDRVSNACIIEMVADYSGENIVQERVYDENMNLIYSFSRVSVGNRQFVGSYRDTNGFPAEMRNDSSGSDNVDVDSGSDKTTFARGTLVRITEDQWGNDSVIQFTDSRGVPKLNGDAASLSIYIYDQQGHLLKNQSCDLDGNLIIDNCENCGYEMVWDSAHNLVSSTCMDNNWQPIKNSDGVVTSVSKYDQYGREIEEYYTDAEGNPCQDTLGTHRKTYEYNEHGKVVKNCAYDLAGNPSPLDDSGDATELFEYDARGFCTKCVFLDVDNKPNQQVGYLSRIVREYDSDGKKILEQQYAFRSGSERLTYEYKATPQYHRTQWEDGSFRIDSLDAQERRTFIGFYDAQGNLEMVGGHAYQRTTLDERDHQCTIAVIDYDNQGNWVDYEGSAKLVTKIDSVNWTKTYWKYDHRRVLTETYIHQYDSGFNNMLAQYDCNSFGIRSRSGGADNVQCYTAWVTHAGAVDGNVACISGLDEFGEPDYIVDDAYEIYCSQMISHEGYKTNFDENGQVISYYDDLRNRLPKVMTVEVTDSCAYALGLRDNDVIILYGDYAAKPSDARPNLFTFRFYWGLASVLNADKPKRMVVFRVDTASRSYGLHEIILPAGTPSQLGFLPHLRYLTERQNERIERAIAWDMRTDTPLLTAADRESQDYAGDNYVIMAYTEMRRSMRDKPYARQVADPALLLSACVEDWGLQWNMTEGEEAAIRAIIDARDNDAVVKPVVDYYLTRDANTITVFVQDEDDSGTRWCGSKVNDDIYDRLLALNSPVQDLVAARVSANTVNPVDICGRWRIDSPTSTDQKHASSGTIELASDNTCRGTMVGYAKISFSESDTAVVKIQNDITGEWAIQGHKLLITPVSEDNLKLEAVACSDTTDMPMLAFYCEVKPDLILSILDENSVVQYNDLLIKAVDAKRGSLTIEDGAGGLRLTRLKGKTATIDPKRLRGSWRIAATDEQPMPKGDIYFGKDGTCYGHVVSLANKIYSDGDTAAIIISKEFAGKWRHHGRRVAFNLEDCNEQTPFLVNYTGTDGFETTIKSQCENEPSMILRGLRDTNDPFADEMLIRSLDGDTLTVVVNDTDVKLARAKGKPEPVERRAGITSESELASADDQPADIIGLWKVLYHDEDDSPKVVMRIRFNPDSTLWMSFGMQGALLELDGTMSVSVSGRWVEQDRQSIAVTSDLSTVEAGFNPDDDGEVSQEARDSFRQFFENHQSELAASIVPDEFVINRTPDGGLEFEGETLDRVHEIILGRIVDEQGWWAAQGLPDLFVVLRWAWWDCESVSDEFSSVFGITRGLEKDIVILPVTFDDDDNAVFGEITMVHCPNEIMGVEIDNIELKESYYQEYIAASYKAWINTLWLEMQENLSQP